MNVVSKKQAYLVMAYDNFEQLIKLVHALDDERNMIFIHIDKKAKNFTSEIKSKILGGRKCKIEIYGDIAVYWSHYSQVECELFLLERAETLLEKEFGIIIILENIVDSLK